MPAPTTPFAADLGLRRTGRRAGIRCPRVAMAATTAPAATRHRRPLPPLRLRPPRHPRPLPRVRGGDDGGDGDDVMRRARAAVHGRVAGCLAKRIGGLTWIEQPVYAAR